MNQGLTFVLKHKGKCRPSLVSERKWEPYDLCAKAIFPSTEEQDTQSGRSQETCLHKPNTKECFLGYGRQRVFIYTGLWRGMLRTGKV